MPKNNPEKTPTVEELRRQLEDLQNITPAEAAPAEEAEPTPPAEEAAPPAKEAAAAAAAEGAEEPAAEKILKAIPFLISEIERWKNILIINKSYLKDREVDIYDISDDDYSEINKEYLTFVESIKLNNSELQPFLESFKQKMFYATKDHIIKIGLRATHDQIIDEKHTLYTYEQQAHKELVKKIKKLIEELIEKLGAEAAAAAAAAAEAAVAVAAKEAAKEAEKAAKEAAKEAEKAAAVAAAAKEAEKAAAKEAKEAAEAPPAAAAVAKEQDLQALADKLFNKKNFLIKNEEELFKKKKLLEYSRKNKYLKLAKSIKLEIEKLEFAVKGQREDFESLASSILEGMSEEQKNELFKLLQDKLRELYLKKAIDANGIIAQKKKKLREHKHKHKLKIISIREKIRELKAKNTLSKKERNELHDLVQYEKNYEEKLSVLNVNLTEEQELFYYFLQKADEYNKTTAPEAPVVAKLLIERVRKATTVADLYAGLI